MAQLIDSGTGPDITDEEAKNDFLEFVDWYTTERAASPDPSNLPIIGYRMDTWQMWAKCPEPHNDITSMCRNPGLHLEIDAPSPMPYQIMVGPYQLFRERTMEDAFGRLAQEATFQLVMANGHMHMFGQPHHVGCELCQEVPATPNA